MPCEGRLWGESNEPQRRTLQGISRLYDYKVARGRLVPLSPSPSPPYLSPFWNPRLPWELDKGSSLSRMADRNPPWFFGGNFTMSHSKMMTWANSSIMRKFSQEYFSSTGCQGLHFLQQKCLPVLSSHDRGGSVIRLCPKGRHNQQDSISRNPTAGVKVRVQAPGLASFAS